MQYVREVGVVVGFVSLALSVTVRADTLVMRDGRRVEGDLVAVREGVIEWDGRRGLFGGHERMRVERDDVRAIELSDSGRTSYTSDDRDREDRGRPSGMREREVSVDSWIQWKDTGIDLRAGQTV